MVNEDHPGLLTSDALFCAEDAVRNRKFYQAIGKAVADVKENCSEVVVCDAGAGIGILGMMALLHGADRVYFIESNPQTLQLCREFVPQSPVFRDSLD